MRTKTFSVYRLVAYLQLYSLLFAVSLTDAILNRGALRHVSEEEALAARPKGKDHVRSRRWKKKERKERRKRKERKGEERKKVKEKEGEDRLTLFCIPLLFDSQTSFFSFQLVSSLHARMEAMRRSVSGQEGEEDSSGSDWSDTEVRRDG